MDGSSPTGAGAAPSVSTTAAPVAPAGAPPAPTGAPGAPLVEGGGAPLTAKEARFLHKHRLEDGTEIDVDLAGYKHRTKVDGKDVELDLREMERGYGLTTAAFRRFEEAAQTKKQAEAQLQQVQRFQAAMKSPETVIAHLERLIGPERLNEWAESRVVERMRLDKMPQQQREQYEAERRRSGELRTKEQQIADRERRIAEQEKAYRAERAQATLAKWRQEWPNDFASLGLPNEPAVMTEATDRAMEMLARARRLGAPMTIRDAQEQAAKHMLGVLEASAKYAASRTQAKLEAQPGRQREEPASGGAPFARRERAPQATGYGAVLADLAKNAGR